ncbi:MAG: indole-3-glycerol phosphate synthase TrpC [Wenzhouxiangellaceae bacterium]
MSIPSVLQRILDTKRAEVEAGRRTRPLSELKARIADLPATRGFADRLARTGAEDPPAVIAEFKRASPSAGWIAEHADPGRVAQAYEAAGAACLSVLTDAQYFRGAIADLQAARDACTLPVLRKDFVIDAWQVFETRAIGADAMLLIVAALDDARLAEFSAIGEAVGLDVLVEVHDEAELERALKVPGRLLGINNRDLHRFRTRLETSERLAPRVPPERIAIAESGIHSAADLQRLQQAGIGAFLIGESLMRDAEPGAALASLRGRAPDHELQGVPTT